MYNKVLDHGFESRSLGWQFGVARIQAPRALDAADAVLHVPDARNPTPYPETQHPKPNPDPEP